MKETLLPYTQVYVLVIGSLVPLAAYVINHYAPWVDERIKALVQVVVAAASAGLYQALEVGHIGLNGTTLQLVVTAIIGALGAHKLLCAHPNASTTK
jgi:mannitol-specific phosphotransferase system IIBC component